MKPQKHTDEEIAAAMLVLQEHFLALARERGTHYIRDLRIGDFEFTATYQAHYQDPDVKDPAWDDTGRFLSHLEIVDMATITS